MCSDAAGLKFTLWTFFNLKIIKLISKYLTYFVLPVKSVKAYIDKDCWNCISFGFLAVVTIFNVINFFVVVVSFI